ncbi:MAG: SpoIIE family protein phosphatase [Thermoguttaceae bacterium]
MDGQESSVVDCEADTHRRIAELEAQVQHLQKAEAWFRMLLDAAPDAVVIVDETGRIVLVNEQTEAIFGYSKTELLGQAVELLIPDRFHHHHVAHRAAYAQHPHCRPMGASVELHARRSDGSEFPAEISLSPRQTPQGTLVFCMVRDITRRKLAERALQDSEERFELAVHGTDAGIWDWDLRTNRVYFSSRWKSMLGCSDAEISDDFQEWERRIHPDDYQRSVEMIRRYLDGEILEYSLEHRLRHKNGTYRWILARGAALRDDQGHPYRMAGSHIDITELKQTQAVLHDRHVQLAAAQKIQEHLLPQRPPFIPGLEVIGASHPAEFAAGDHFDYFRMPDTSLAIVIGDVTGHGFGPALIMASVHTLIRSLSQRYCDITDILQHANRFLCEETADHFFATVFFARIDTETHRLEYASAGHPPAYVFGPDGQVKARLESTGIPLGIYPDHTTPMGPGLMLEENDVVLLLTDGAIETESPDGEIFGIERAIQCVRRSVDCPAQQILDRLYQAVLDFSGHVNPQDDITAVVLKVTPTGPLPPDDQPPADLPR